MAIVFAETAFTKVNLKFQQGAEFDSDRLIRDLLDYTYAMELRLAEFESVIQALDARLIAGGH